MAAPVGHTAGTSFAWNTRGQTIAAATVLPGLAIITVALRFWTRYHRQIAFGLDDVFIVPALLCVIGLGITLLVGVAKHVIAHTTPPNPNKDPQAQLYQISPAQVAVEKIEWIFFFISIFAYGFIKLSVLFFYRRLFADRSSNHFDIISKVAIVIVVAWTLAYGLAEILRCGGHVAAFWGPLIELAHCKTAYKFINTLFITDLITDLLVVGLPIPIVLRLHMTTSRKLGIIGVLLLGVISIVASAVRIVYGFQIASTGLAAKTDVDGRLIISLQSDLLLSLHYATIAHGRRCSVSLTNTAEGLTTLLYWGMLEAGISIIATNLPSLHFLVTKKSVRSIVASLRSQLSLGSNASSRSKSRRRTPYYEMKANNSSASQAPALHPDSGMVDTSVTHDTEPMPIPQEPDRIHVKSDIRQHDEMVS
ncbi:MAG: hypothetical protein Q9191_000537 [Dirinaria sp. TL-2023a]